MEKETVLFKEVNSFSKIIIDYVDKKENLNSFYDYLPTSDNFIRQADLKAQSYENRKILCEALKKQYEGIKIHQNVSENLRILEDCNTFTITTGHQLNLFTGPLYFIYKIICVINLAEQMNQKSNDKKFVPIYWMATEDHDFDEINHFNYKDKVVRWNSDQNGAVGRFNLEGIEDVLKAIELLLPNSKKKIYLLQLFKKAYLESNSLARATRILANALFEEYGLIIIDGDDVALKSLFVSYVEEELLKQTAFEKVSNTINELKEFDYKIQVNPREINLFYLLENGRERIVYSGDKFKINNTSLEFTKEEILNELNQYPEKFSPNVIMRPLYQEVILPNVAYIGGGGEIAYWLELKSFFNSQKIPFPILKLRNSVLVLNKYVYEKIINKNLILKDVFQQPAVLFDRIVRKETAINLSFKEYFETFEQEFIKLKELAKETDKSFINAVKAHEKKIDNSIKILEKRLLKAEKRKFVEQKDSIEYLYFKVHPNGKVQERTYNISEIIIDTDITFVNDVKRHLDPFKDEFIILTF